MCESAEAIATDWGAFRSRP